MTPFPPRLPRAVEADPRAEDVRLRLAGSAELLRPGSDVLAASTPMSDALAAALQRVRSAGRIVRGLESAEPVLAAEERGQRLADRQADTARGARISRLLLANDGSDRFYRQVESLLRRHRERVLALRVDADAAALGALLFGPDSLARLVLIEHKEAVADVLFALLGRGRAAGEPAAGPA